MIDRLARDGDPQAFDFPRSLPDGPEGSGGLDFSFSGLKTSLLYRVRDLGEQEAERRRADLAASYQAAIVGSLTARLGHAIRREGVERVALGGGVAANSQLRAEAARLCDELGVRLWTPARALCTDNAAMIGAAARFTPAVSYPGYLALDAAARLE